MPLVAASTIRFAIEGTFQGAPCVTIWDQFAAEGAYADREEACELLGALLLAEWHTNILQWMDTSYVAQQVSFVDLSQDDGITGSITSSGSISWPATGAISTTNSYTPASATLVTKNTTARRGERAGRMFLPAPREGQVDAGILDNVYLTGLRDSLNDVLENMTTSVGDPSVYPSVTHIRQGAPNVGIPSRVTSMSVRPRLSTQRRRNRG